MRIDRSRSSTSDARAVLWALVIAGAACVIPGARAAAAEGAYRYAAPIVVEQTAPFVQITVPPSVYAHSEQPGLRDLRIVDAAGARVPFSLLDPRPTLQLSERLVPTTLYPLPPRPPGAVSWPSPVDVVVDGDRIRVSRRGGPAIAASTAPPRPSPGWLIDTGERAAGDHRARTLRLDWSGPAEFSARFDLESSDDLNRWRAESGGQLMALQSEAGALRQPLIALGSASGRFVRLTWSEPATAPLVTSAQAIVADTTLANAAVSELLFAPSAAASGGAKADPADARSLQFDLGGALPLTDVDLRFASGTHVAPARLQGRARLDEPWQSLGAGVFYRLESAAGVVESPALALPAVVRYLRIVPDERAAALAGSAPRLIVHAAVPTLVFAAEGLPPYRLLAGDKTAPAGALPPEALVPRLDDERPRFGHASIGAFAEVPAVAQAAAQASQAARLRPLLLWAVLIAGIAILGAFVWRLARSPAAPSPVASPREGGDHGLR